MSNDTTHYTIHWVSADGQGSIDMSGYYAADGWESARALAESVLLDQCGEEFQRDDILAGRWEGQ